MSNQKLRTIIYTVILVILIFSGLGYLLAHEDGLTQEKAQEYYLSQQAAFNEIADYMISKEISADVTDVPTPDQHYGIQSEESDAYRSFMNTLVETMRATCKRIHSDGASVEFYFPAKGGLLCPRHVVIAYGDAVDGIGDSSKNRLNSDGWYYYLVSGRP